jgi:integrase
MASISNDPNGHRRILFVAGDGTRKTLRLGKVSQRVAAEIKTKVEALNASAIGGFSLDNETAAWIGKVGDKLHCKLAAAGLVASRIPAAPQKQTCLGEWLDAYIAGRTDVKPNTHRNLEAAKARLVKFFGADKPLAEITAGDADAWGIWLKGCYANGTAGRTIKRAKQFFREAQRNRIIPESPFADARPPSLVNEARKFFVPLEAAYKVLVACPDAEWQLLFALSRFGGLRCPSEHFALTWADVDWERERFLVRSSKTEHRQGKPERWVPIFPELRPHLEAAFEQAEDGAVYVFQGRRDTSANLRTRLMKIIRRAGLTPWPKLFHNLRASCETELAAAYAMHVVCAWIGNTERIAAKHYLQVTEDYFARAVEKSGAENGAPTAQKPAQQADARHRMDSQEMQKPWENPGFLPEYAAPCETVRAAGYPQGDSNPCLSRERAMS